MVSAYRKILFPSEQSSEQVTAFPAAQQAFLRHWLVEIMTITSDAVDEIYEEDNDIIWDALGDLDAGFCLAVYDATLHWVVDAVAQGCLEKLNSRNDRQQRMSMWISLLTKDSVTAILAPLKGELTKDEFLPFSDTRQYFVSIARLADCILLFHLCQDQDPSKHPRYCSWNIDHFRHIMKGFYLSATSAKEMEMIGTEV